MYKDDKSLERTLASLEEKKRLYRFRELLNSDADLEASWEQDLLARTPPDAYMSDWQAVIGNKPLQEASLTTVGLLVFCLGSEAFAISSKHVTGVVEPRPIHHIPHMLEGCISGLVNVKGQLKICISLHRLLNVHHHNSSKTPTQKNYPRMVSIEELGGEWVFPVDELYGIFDCEKDEIRNVPTTVSGSSSPYIEGLIQWGEFKSVGIIDLKKIVTTLKTALTHFQESKEPA